MLQAFEVNFDGFSTEFEKCLDYLHFLCFTFSSTLAKQRSPLLLIENKLIFTLQKKLRQKSNQYQRAVLWCYI